MVLNSESIKQIISTHDEGLRGTAGGGEKEKLKDDRQEACETLGAADDSTHRCFSLSQRVPAREVTKAAPAARIESPDGRPVKVCTELGVTTGSTIHSASHG